MTVKEAQQRAQWTLIEGRIVGSKNPAMVAKNIWALAESMDSVEIRSGNVTSECYAKVIKKSVIRRHGRQRRMFDC